MLCQLCAFVLLATGADAAPVTALSVERQITTSPMPHNLDNNDNFSMDSAFLCFDGRGLYGSGIENSTTIGKVEIASQKETVVYQVPKYETGASAAPGVGAVSFSPVENKVIFIHGPFLEEVPVRGYYAKTNRRGAEVVADGSGRLSWVDRRDVAKDRYTIPGAHRGGTHRHEYTLDGKRIGFTYDDALLPDYQRTIGYLEASAKAPEGASHYFAVLVSVAPKGTAKPGELEKAAGDSWVGRRGLMRAFIGTVRADNGKDYEDSLFVVDVPADVDIASADSGSATRYPAPPKGVKVRRLTHTPASGVARGTPDGRRIAYFANAPDGSKQVFVIASDGSDRDADPAKRPVQLTRFAKGADGSIRWSPNGDSVFCMSNNAVVETWAGPGTRFGKSRFLTAEGDKPARIDLVVAPNGKLAAFTKAVPTQGADGKVVKTFAGDDLPQIFVLPIPEWR